MKKVIKRISALAVIAAVFGEFYLIVLMRRHREESEKKCYNKMNKLEANRFLLAIWADNMLNHHSIADYFQKRGIQKIVIYGTDIEADILDKELQNTQVNVSGFMENGSQRKLYRNKDMFEAADIQDMKDLDAIVVASILSYDEVRADLKKLTDAKVLSLRDIVFQVKKEGEE